MVCVAVRRKPVAVVGDQSLDRKRDGDRRQVRPAAITAPLGIVPYHSPMPSSPTCRSSREVRPRRRSVQTRERVLAVADELFYTDGIRATGVDAVAAAAGVAPTTLYRLFASKDDLVAAYVERYADRYRAVLSEAIFAAAPFPRDQILAMIDAFASEVLSGSCRGCPFLMVLAEYPDPASAAHRGAVAHKAWVRDRFRELVAELTAAARLRDPDLLVQGLALIAEGMYASVQALGPDGPAAYGRACAEAMLAAGEQEPGTGARRPTTAARSEP